MTIKSWMGWWKLIGKQQQVVSVEVIEDSYDLCKVKEVDFDCNL